MISSLYGCNNALILTFMISQSDYYSILLNELPVSIFFFKGHIPVSIYMFFLKK